MARGIDYVDVYGEGSVNAEFKIGYDDGSVEEFYSIDQGSPRSMVDDSPLADTRPKLAQLLMTYWGRACAEFDPDEDGKQYTKTFGSAKLKKRAVKSKI